MKPEEADKWLQDLGFFHSKGVQEHFKKGVSLIGETEMLDLVDFFNDDRENSEEYLLNKCAEDPYFSIIHSTKYSIFKEELIWLDQFLPENALVCDMGCSTGHMTAFCAKMRPKSRFIGIDSLPSAIKKAISIKESLNLTNLSFEQFDFTSIKTQPKPDGIISLQALGPFLDRPETIYHLSEYVDAKAFIILVEAFEEQEGLKNILKSFNKQGFVLARFDKIDCGPNRRLKWMPAILLARGFAAGPTIEIDDIHL